METGKRVQGPSVLCLKITREPTIISNKKKFYFQNVIYYAIFLLSKTLKSLPLKSEIRQTCPWAHSTPRVLANQLSGGKKKVGIYKGKKKSLFESDMTANLEYRKTDQKNLSD